MAFHSKRSPSQAKKFIACPGSLALGASVPEELRRGSSDSGRLGTAVHAIIEHCLKHHINADALIDRIVLIIERGEDDEGASILRDGARMPKAKADNYAYIIDQAMTDNATVCIDYVRGRLEELGVAEKNLQLETRTNPLPDRDDTSGSADITIPAFPELLEVDDYKNGGLGVDHVDNEQAMAYLLGKAIEFEFGYETYRTAIIQPNFHHSEGPIRWMEYTAEELQAFQKKYLAAIKKCEKAEAEFEKTGLIDGEVNPVWADRWLKAGDHCTFCDAGGICPARRKAAEELAGIEFSDTPTEQTIQLPAVAKGRAVAGSVEARVGEILSWAPILDSLVRAATLYAHRAMEAGYEIPGQKLVAARSNRKLIDAPAKQIVADLVKQKFLTNEDVERLYTKPQLLSGPQIEKIIPRKLRKKFNKAFLVKPDKGTSIAPVDDPRPSVEPRNPGDDFAEEEEPDFG